MSEWTTIARPYAQAAFDYAVESKTVAQWQEMITDPEQRIGRPRQLYTGEVERKVKPVDKR